MDSERCVDNSTLQSLRKCTTMVAMERIFGYRGNRANYYLDAGTAIHKGMEHFLINGPAGVADVVKNASRHLIEVIDLPPAYHPDNLARIGQIVADSYSTVALPWEPQYVEKAFRVKLTDDVWVNGKVDFMGLEQSGALAVVDWKTTGRLDVKWKYTQKTSSQYPHYLWAMQRLFGNTVWQAYAFGIEIRDVPKSNSKCKLHNLPYAECGAEHLKVEIVPVEVWPQRMDDWYRDAVAGAHQFFNMRDWLAGDVGKVKYLPMEGTFNGQCYSCQFTDFCHIYNRREDIVDTLFVVDPFNPEKDVDVLVEGEVGR